MSPVRLHGRNDPRFRAAHEEIPDDILQQADEYSKRIGPGDRAANRCRMGAMKKPNRQAVSRLVQRKFDHIAACLDDSVDLQRDSFSPYKLRYNALPELALDDVSTEVEFAGKTVAAPLIISSMTGGVGKEFRNINRNLAEAAEELKIPFGLGSMKVMLHHREALPSYEVRHLAPSVPLIANLGLVSFNYGLTYTDMQRVIEMVQPDLFGIHLNALQEVIQEHGDTNFRGLSKHLETIVTKCPLPLYVKECGGGIAPEIVHRLSGMGVHYIDISGNDGTSWSAVEGRLSEDSSMGELFKDFGLPTAWILENLDRQKLIKTKIVASGGIRDGVQAVKAIALGADYVSVARPFLIAALRSPEAVVDVGKKIMQEMRTAMFLLGIARVAEIDRRLLI